MLKISYKSKKLESICTDFKKAQREHGKRMAELIHQRIAELKSAEYVEMLVKYSIGNCHPLTGDRKGEYAMDLIQPYRLIFNKNRTDIHIVKIIKIENYH